MTVKCSLLEAHKTYTVGPLHRPHLFSPSLINTNRTCMYSLHSASELIVHTYKYATYTYTNA